jgi:hypothetical protein
MGDLGSTTPVESANLKQDEIEMQCLKCLANTSSPFDCWIVDGIAEQRQCYPLEGDELKRRTVSVTFYKVCHV